MDRAATLARGFSRCAALNRKTRMMRLYCLLALLSPVMTGHAQTSPTYPSRPVRLIIPYTPGGLPDVVARAIGPELARTMGQNFVVDNRPGANAILGADLVAKANPDGHTLGIFIASHVSNQTLYTKLPFHVVESFTPVTLIGTAPYILAANPSLPASNVKELIALAKGKPGQLSFGSSGVGAGGHLTMELLQTLTGTKMNHVPYKGSAPALLDIMGGNIALLFTVPSSVLQFTKTGKIKALAITSARRSPAAPEIPTVNESGIPGFVSETWAGMLGPAGMSPAIADRLSKEIGVVVKRQDMRERFVRLDIEPVGGTPSAFGKFMREEVVKWGRVIKEANVKPEQ